MLFHSHLKTVTNPLHLLFLNSKNHPRGFNIPFHKSSTQEPLKTQFPIHPQKSIENEHTKAE